MRIVSINNKLSNDYRYGFNGYEKDDEVNGVTGGHLDFADYGYSPRLARRWNVDPKTATYAWQSPYAYAANSPILNVDVDGEGDVTYMILINEKTGKSAFIIIDNELKVDANHFVLHFKNKDGGIETVEVSQEAFFAMHKGISNEGKFSSQKFFTITEAGFKQSGTMYTGNGKVAKKENDGANIDGQSYIGDLLIMLGKVFNKSPKTPERLAPENEFKMSKKIASIIKEVGPDSPNRDVTPKIPTLKLDMSDPIFQTKTVLMNGKDQEIHFYKNSNGDEVQVN